MCPAKKQFDEKSLFLKIIHFTGLVVLSVIAIMALTWGAAALWIDGPGHMLGVVFIASLFLASGIVLYKVRPYWLALLAVVAGVGLVAIWWLSIVPSNDRDWLPDVSRLANAELQGNRLTISNLRNFNYRSETDFDVNWETRHYDLENLRGLDIFLCYWGPTNIAHTILSWEFDNDRYLAISIETRKEKGESYSAIRGFFRQYEVYYVVSDERDVVRLRTNSRGEQLYLYNLSVRRPVAKSLLLDYVNEIKQLAQKPRWYNALTHNCTTAIRYHADHVLTAAPWDLRMLVNGQVDQMLYERKRISTSVPFDELRRLSNITSKALVANYREFSREIRHELPRSQL